MWSSVWNSSWDSDDDGDGIKNILDDDSDGDGYLDGYERDHSANPGDVNDVPTPELVTGVTYANGVLSWNASPGVENYRIHFGPSAGNLTYTHMVYNATSQGLSLPPGWYMSVAGFNAANEEGPLSEVVSNSPPLTAVTGLILEAGVLSWDPMAGVAFNVYFATSPENIMNGNVYLVYTNSLNFGSVPPGYYFAVTPVAGSEEGPLSEIVTSNVPIPEVTGLAYQSGILSWDAADGISEYKVFYGTDSGNLTAAVSVYTNHCNLNAPPGYYFWIAAVDSFGKMGELSATVSSTPPIPEITGLTYQNGALSWNAAPGITEFDVYYSNDLTAIENGGGNIVPVYTNHINLNAPPGYYFRVAAVNSIGDSGSLSPVVSSNP